MTTYSEIDGSQTFIFKVIKEQLKNITDDAIKDRFISIRAYGSTETPLFSGLDVYYCLKNTKKKIERDLYPHLLDDEIFKNSRVENINRPVNLINEWGVIHACYLFKSEIAIIFQKFIREVVRQLKEKGVAALAEVNENLKKQLAEECRKTDLLEQANFYQAIDINKQETMAEMLSNEEFNGEDERKELMLLREQYMRPIPLYLVDTSIIVESVSKKRNLRKNNTTLKQKDKPKYKPRKRGVSTLTSFGMSDSEDESHNPHRNLSDNSENGIYADILDYDHRIHSIHSLKSTENEIYYFHLGSYTAKKPKLDKSYKFITNIYFDSKDHYDYAIRLIAGKENLTKVKGVYESTYADIINYVSRAYINLRIRANNNNVAVQKTQLVKNIKTIPETECRKSHILDSKYISIIPNKSVN